jgi:hypothetical protein
VREVNVGEVVNYKSLLDDFPQITIPVQVYCILAEILLTAIMLGWTLGSRWSIIAVRVTLVFSVFSCCFMSIYVILSIDFMIDFMYEFNEFHHLKQTEFEGQIYNLAEEHIEQGDPDGVSHRYNYWLFKCDDSQQECMVMFSTYFQRQYYSFENVPTDLFIDDSASALVLTVDDEIVFTVPASDN